MSVASVNVERVATDVRTVQLPVNRKQLTFATCDCAIKNPTVFGARLSQNWAVSARTRQHAVRGRPRTGQCRHVPDSMRCAVIPELGGVVTYLTACGARSPQNWTVSART